MKNNDNISFINFYKHINKISTKKNNDKSNNDILLNNNKNKINFPLNKFPNYNHINKREIIKFKTSKNSPNSSLKKINLNNIKNMKNNNIINKDLSENNYLNNDTMKINFKLSQNKKQEFDDFFIKKIKQVYTNKKFTYNNKIKKLGQKSKSSNKLIINQKIKDDNYTPKDNFLFNNTNTNNTNIIKKKIINVSDFKKIDKNNQLNMTNYKIKSKDYNNNFINNNYNEDSNNTNYINYINDLSDLKTLFNVKNNPNHSGIIFSNEQNYNSIGKEKNIINNQLKSPNYFSLHKNNSNTNTNNILIQYIENKYNNIIDNKTILNKKNTNKILFNNENNYRNYSSKNNKIKYYIKDNYIFHNNHSKSINKININHNQIFGENPSIKYSTTMNSNNNSRKSTPNKMKIKIKYKENIINKNNNNNNNLIISNIGHNINSIYNNINNIDYLSGKNSDKNILLHYIKEKDNFIHRNNLFDSSKNITLKSFINNNIKGKDGKEGYFGDINKNKNKSITNIYHININNNKIKTQISYDKNNNDIFLYNKDKSLDINNNLIIEQNSKDISINNSKNKNKIEKSKLIKKLIHSTVNNGNYNKTANTTNKKSYMINSKQTDSSSIIKVNCINNNKKEDKEIKNNILYENNIKDKNILESQKKEIDKQNNNISNSINNNMNISIKEQNINKNIQYYDEIKKDEKGKIKDELKNDIKNKIINKKLEIDIENKNDINDDGIKEIIMQGKKLNQKIICDNNDNNVNKYIEIKENNNDNEIKDKTKKDENNTLILNEMKENKDIDKIIENNNNDIYKNNNNLNKSNNKGKNIIQNNSLKENETKNNGNNIENSYINNNNKCNEDMKKDSIKEENNNYNNDIIEEINIINNEENNNIVNNIYNKNLDNIQNITTQIKNEEKDNYFNHIMTTDFDKDKNNENYNDYDNDKTKQEDKQSNEINICNNIIINNNNDINEEHSYKNNYEEYPELLCNIKNNNENGNNKKEEEKSILSTQSRDCLYYQNELLKLSSYIKKYYSEKNSYPQSGIEFYLFGREIGHGAFGKVNICLHIASGRLIAMKTFVKKDIKYKETKDKLKTEVEVLSKLRHPYINQILDSFETETHFFIVMEYICGDLLSFIRKRNKLNEISAKIIFKQIIEGIKYIHKKKIIHRDIKLDNILLDLTNTIKICDFGVSRKIEKGKLIYERCGTPAYIAPEIYAKLGYDDGQSDIWSAGVTLYYILSGTLPFKGSNIQELEKVILSGEFEEIKDVSNEANDIIRGMLRTDPKKRLSVDEILKHPWLKNINLENRYKLNIFTEAEKNLLTIYDVDYLNSSKSDLIENFTYRNLDVDTNKKKVGGNTKSIIYAPYNSCVNEDSKEEEDKNIISYLNKEEKALYEELEIENNICKFGWRVKQANINYELSNNDDFDNGLIKSVKEEEFKNKNEIITNNEDTQSKNKTLESLKDYEKIKIDKNILEYIENNVGYDKKYLTKCLKKNIINYATATYYLLFKDKKNNENNNG